MVTAAAGPAAACPGSRTAFNLTVLASNACGAPPEDYCMQTGSTRLCRLCHRCDASDLARSHGAGLLTDFHTSSEPTWWQSQSMYYGVQYPNSVNITLHLVIANTLPKGTSSNAMSKRHQGKIYFPYGTD
ncbi:hypothetical protein NHX12_026975 [Muraenolepis orangiensis]|uniref:Laminin N-terminal domain-containing protein n=1 Tax=Muraenolepis orangiensis TaxID=630683 RepID=A0A9Q0ECQ6_9TELE|nr:hypothetical protein NHX12_026975 [Muraenolepis orangiensis]